MKTINWTADNTQESESKLENKAAYRAPRLVALGSAVDVVQFAYGNIFDSSSGNGREYKR